MKNQLHVTATSPIHPAIHPYIKSNYTSHTALYGPIHHPYIVQTWSRAWCMAIHPYSAIHHTPIHRHTSYIPYSHPSVRDTLTVTQAEALLDDGLLTQDEFDAKKKELLQQV